MPRSQTSLRFTVLGEKRGVDAPQREEKWRGEEREVMRQSKNSRDREIVCVCVWGGALKPESRRARATEAEALFVEN